MFASGDSGLVVAQVYIGVVTVSALSVAVAAMEDLQLRRAEERVLLHRALHDPLTGVGNRAMLDERVSTGDVAGVIAVDLDGFKQVNDRYGHHVGDEVLRQVAARLASVAGPSDTVIRLGGDEFVVLLTGWNDEDTLESITTRLRSVLAPPYDAADLRLVVRASAGVIGPGSHDSVAELLRVCRPGDVRRQGVPNREQPLTPTTVRCRA